MKKDFFLENPLARNGKATHIPSGKFKLHMFSDSQKKRGCAVMCIAVTMHNIPEGMAVGVAFGAVLAKRKV